MVSWIRSTPSRLAAPSPASANNAQAATNKPRRRVVRLHDINTITGKNARPPVRKPQPEAQASAEMMPMPISEQPSSAHCSAAPRSASARAQPTPSVAKPSNKAMRTGTGSGEGIKTCISTPTVAAAIETVR